MPTQGSTSLAKDDTHFHATGVGITGLTADLSQHGTNWTAGATVIYSADSSRLSDRDTRVVGIDVVFDNTVASGTVYARDDNPTSDSDSNGIQWNTSSNVIECYTAGSLRVSLAPPSISGSGDRYIIVWSSMPNPDTTGASDLVYSELQIWNVSQSTYAQAVFTHAVYPTTGTDRIFFGAYNTSSAGTFAGAYAGVRYSVGRFHTATEGNEDWIALTAAPSLTLEDRIEQLVPPSSAGLGAAGRTPGPVEIMCSRGVIQNKLRLVSALVNRTLEDQPWLENSWANISDADRLSWPTALPQLLRRHVYVAPVPNVVNRIRPRVFLQSDMDTTASDTGNDLTHIMCICAERRPTGSADTDFVYYTSTQTTSTDQGAGATSGSWIDFGQMKIARDSDGATFLMFAVWFTGTATDQRCRIKAVTVEPGLETEDGDEIPVGVGG